MVRYPAPALCAARMRGTADISRRLEEYEKNQLSVYVKRLDTLVAELVHNFLPKKKNQDQQEPLPHYDLAESDYTLSVNANKEIVPYLASIYL